MKDTIKTPRRFTAAIRKILKAEGVEAAVASRTLSFAGFGYGSACSAEVTPKEPLTDGIKEKLKAAETEFRAGPGGPHFSEKQMSAFQIRLCGDHYPFSQVL